MGAVVKLTQMVGFDATPCSSVKVNRGWCSPSDRSIVEAVLDQARRWCAGRNHRTVSSDRLIVSVGDERSAECEIDQPATVLLDRWGFSVERSINQA